MAAWYAFWLSLVESIYSWPIRLAYELATFSLQIDFILSAAPVVSAALLFFTNEAIFPMYLQLAFVFYTACFVLTLIVNAIKLLWDLLPFV